MTHAKPIIKIPKPKMFWALMTLMIAYSVAATYVDDHMFPHQQVKEAGAATILGLILRLLLAFRTNTSYDRWWEGRKRWGQLVNDIRNLGLKADNYLCATKEQRKSFADLLVAFPYSLKDHLRSERPGEKVLALISSAADAEHVPLYITDQLFSLTHDRTNTENSAIDRLTIDPHLRALMDICGACERIKNTPISQTYKDLIILLLGLYLLILPWMLVPLIDEWSVLVTAIVSFFAITIELLAQEIEQPFGYEVNDLPLDGLCQTIERSIRQISE